MYRHGGKTKKDTPRINQPFESNNTTPSLTSTHPVPPKRLVPAPWEPPLPPLHPPSLQRRQTPDTHTHTHTHIHRYPTYSSFQLMQRKPDPFPRCPHGLGKEGGMMGWEGFRLFPLLISSHPIQVIGDRWICYRCERAQRHSTKAQGIGGRRGCRGIRGGGRRGSALVVYRGTMYEVGGARTYVCTRGKIPPSPDSRRPPSSGPVLSDMVLSRSDLSWAWGWLVLLSAYYTVVCTKHSTAAY